VNILDKEITVGHLMLLVPVAVLGILIGVLTFNLGFAAGARQGQLDASNGKWTWHLKDNQWQPVDPPTTRPLD
jgi:uncharacterized membrane protein